MKHSREHRSVVEQVYEGEFQLLEQARALACGDLSREKLAEEFTKLGNEYEKLLKQIIKITRVGDANQRKLLLANEQIEKHRAELSVAYEKLDLIARTDPLTGLSNRRDFLERFEHEIARFERNKKPFSLVLGDIDDFKMLNDRYGHDCGDYVLVQLAVLLRESVRKQDAVARWGGEEFILLLPEAPLDGGIVAAEAIRQKIASESYRYNDHRLAITMTFGVSEFNGTKNIDAAIKSADEALYSGKVRGKNCVVNMDDPPGGT